MLIWVCAYVYAGVKVYFCVCVFSLLLSINMHILVIIQS